MLKKINNIILIVSHVRKFLVEMFMCRYPKIKGIEMKIVNVMQPWTLNIGGM